MSKDKGWTACSKLALGGKKKKKKNPTKLARNLDQEQENSLLKQGMERLICLLKNFTSIRNALGLTTIHAGQPKLLDFNYMKEIILPGLSYEAFAAWITV